MNRTIQAEFRSNRRTGNPPRFDPGSLARVALIKLALERLECLKTCDGPNYSNDTALVLADAVYKLRGRDLKAGKTAFFNDTAATIRVFEEGQLIAILLPESSYAPPFGSTGELTASSSLPGALLRVTTQRFCDCGDAATYIDAEPIGSFLL